MALFSKELGIDLGTANSAAEGSQILIEEPTVATSL
jgi:actin-like ATPase involved in cell morphogenesis